METHRLIPHSDSPPRQVRSIAARVVSADADWLRLRWRIDGAERVVFPAFAGKGGMRVVW